jgi:hypothetical protein
MTFSGKIAAISTVKQEFEAPSLRKSGVSPSKAPSSVAVATSPVKGGG